MPRLTALLAAPLLMLCGVVQAALPGAVVKTDQVRAELVAHAPQGIAPGRPVWLGLAIEHQPHWHTYWKNPGDSGLPTTLQWELPAGFRTGEIDWPTPQRLPIGPLVNYGYEGTLLLPVRLELPAAFQGETLPVKLHAEWLVCKEVCIPESGDFALTLDTRSTIATHADAFAAAAVTPAARRRGQGGRRHRAGRARGAGRRACRPRGRARRSRSSPKTRV